MNSNNRTSGADRGQETMLAISITHFGGPEVLVPVSARVQCLARKNCLSGFMPRASIDRISCNGAANTRHHPEPPKFRGSKIAGQVVGLGNDVGRFNVGDKVCALVPGGGYAEYCTVHFTNALPVPQGRSMVEAGALQRPSSRFG